MQYLDEGGVQQLDGDYIPSRSSLSGSNYFERESQIMHFVSCMYNNADTKLQQQKANHLSITII